MRNPSILVSDHVRHKPACRVTEEGPKACIFVFKKKRDPCSENKGADQRSILFVHIKRVKPVLTDALIAPFPDHCLLLPLSVLFVKDKQTK